MITTLIDKRDNSEILREQIGMILQNELSNQRSLAITAGRDPALWTLNVYTERANAFEQFLNQASDQIPIVNVWYDNSSFEKSSSTISERQRATSVYNIDVYGYGVARDSVTGFVPGDEDSANRVQAAARLVRNILMAASNTYLLMQGVVWQRWITSMTQFQPQIDDRAAQQIRGMRIDFSVMHNEFSPQVVPVDLEYVALDVFRTEDGALIAEADYNFGSP